MSARGFRNCNPLNIDRHAGTVWQGQAEDQSSDDRFVVFTTVPYGYRAAVKILDRYQKVYGLWTVRDIINRWAPPTENDTRSYANHVAELCGAKPLEHFPLLAARNMRNLLRAMTIHENGSCPYSDTVLDRGIDLARGGA